MYPLSPNNQLTPRLRGDSDELIPYYVGLTAAAAGVMHCLAHFICRTLNQQHVLAKPLLGTALSGIWLITSPIMDCRNGNMFYACLSTFFFANCFFIALHHTSKIQHIFNATVIATSISALTHDPVVLLSCFIGGGIISAISCGKL